MAHKLYRLLDSVYNTPLLITASALKPIVEYLQDRNSPAFSFVPDAKTAEEKKAEQVGGIGEIKVSGAITYKPVEGICGPTGTSYTGILDEAQELIDSGVHTILLTLASSGGAAAHCFTTCEELRDMCTEANVKLISYIDEQAASAALALSVISDEVIIHPSASTGSVGCVCCIVDQSKALDMAGIKPIFISSTPGKTPFMADGSFSEGFLSTLQEEVTELGNQFAAHVHKFTGVPIEEILAMDAKMFTGEKAVEAGLANKVMTHKQLVKYLTEQQGVKK
jgi:ClpP class serine protease